MLELSPSRVETDVLGERPDQSSQQVASVRLSVVIKSPDDFGLYPNRYPTRTATRQGWRGPRFLSSAASS
jgi:hypothetical protein